MNSKKEESILFNHGRLVVMSQLASGANGQKFQHAIEKSSGSLILVIQGKLIPGKSLTEIFEKIVNSFQSAQGKTDEIGANVSFILKHPDERRIISAQENAGMSRSDHAIAARGVVNWTNYQVELQSVITAGEGLDAMDSSNIPMDETLYIEFLKRVQLPETLSRNALIGKMNLIRCESGYDSITVNWTNYQVELQSVITAGEGLDAMDSSNISMDETLYIEFLKRVQLPETLLRNALIGKMNLIRCESRSAEINKKEIEKRYFKAFFDSRAEFDYKLGCSLVELKKWVNHDSQKTRLPETFKEAVNSNKGKQKKFISFLSNQLIKKN